MKKVVLFALIPLFCLLVSAANLNVTAIDHGSLILSGGNEPARYTLVIHNYDQGDIFQIISLSGVTINPRNAFTINQGQTIEYPIELLPDASLRAKNRGVYAVDYQIKGQTTGIYNGVLYIKILDLSDTFEVIPTSFTPDAGETVVQFRNIERIPLQDVKIHFSSDFFNTEKTVSFLPFQRQNVTIPLEIKSGLHAGKYPMKITYEVLGAKDTGEGTVDYLERDLISVTEDSKGFIIRSNSVEKKNVGNIVATAEIRSRKNILTRLFTTYSDRPTTAVRAGVFVDYTWSKDLEPGETYIVTVTTNYTFPFILVILIVLITVAVQLYSQSNVSVEKRVSLVRTKGGEFALQVRVKVRSKAHVDNIQVIDRLPYMAQLYEKFGTKPDRYEESSRRIFWNIPRLNAGEERTFSYIIYSKLNVVGKFELPSATAVYEHKGKTFEVFSNKTFFAAETARGE